MRNEEKKISLKKLDDLKKSNFICRRCGKQIVSYPYTLSGDKKLCIDCHMIEREVEKAGLLIEKENRPKMSLSDKLCDQKSEETTHYPLQD